MVECMNNTSLKAIIEKFENLFSIFNKKYYNNELQTPVITVSPDTTRGAYGWCTSWKAWKDSEDEDGGYYEINMCAEHLNRDFKEVCATLLHEMVHLWNLQNNVQDTSRSGTYHNKNFKVEAEKHGLIIEKDSKYGWTITKLNDECSKFIEGLKHESFKLHRKKMIKVNTSSTRQSTRKYVCPSCGCIVRATKEVNILCGDCNEYFEEEY